MTIGIERTPKGTALGLLGRRRRQPEGLLRPGHQRRRRRDVVASRGWWSMRTRKNLPMDRSVLVGNLWTDPLGRLWLIFDQSMDMFDGRAGVWAAICENPDAERARLVRAAPHLARRHAEQAHRAFHRRVDAADLARPARGLRAVQGAVQGTRSPARRECVRLHRPGRDLAAARRGAVSQSRLARAHDRRAQGRHALDAGPHGQGHHADHLRPTAAAPGRSRPNRPASASPNARFSHPPPRLGPPAAGQARRRRRTPTKAA